MPPRRPNGRAITVFDSEPKDLFMARASEFGDRYIKIRYPASASPNRYYVVANVEGAQTIIGNFTVPKGSFAGSIAILVNVEGPFTVAGSSDAMSTAGSIGLFTQDSPETKINYDRATTSILGAAGTTVSCVGRGA
jgi:hypothetical protein